MMVPSHGALRAVLPRSQRNARSFSATSPCSPTGSAKAACTVDAAAGRGVETERTVCATEGTSRHGEPDPCMRRALSGPRTRREQRLQGGSRQQRFPSAQTVTPVLRRSSGGRRKARRSALVQRRQQVRMAGRPPESSPDRCRRHFRQARTSGRHSATASPSTAGESPGCAGDRDQQQKRAGTVAKAIDHNACAASAGPDERRRSPLISSRCEIHSRWDQGASQASAPERAPGLMQGSGMEQLAGIRGRRASRRARRARGTRPPGLVVAKQDAGAASVASSVSCTAPSKAWSRWRAVRRRPVAAYVAMHWAVRGCQGTSVRQSGGCSRWRCGSHGGGRGVPPEARRSPPAARQLGTRDRETARPAPSRQGDLAARMGWYRPRAPRTHAPGCRPCPPDTAFDRKASSAIGDSRTAKNGV